MENEVEELIESGRAGPVWGDVQKIMFEQSARWGLAHDMEHEPWEWTGLIAQYACAGRYVDVAALAMSAEVARRERVRKGLEA